VYTDHYSLSFLKNLSNSNARIHRYACLLSGYNYEVLFKKGSENISDIISRLDYANQLKPSDDSVLKCNENIPKIDFVFKSNPTSGCEQQDTLSESALSLYKLDTQTHESVSPGVASLKNDLAPLILSRSKTINSGASGSSPDGSEVHLRLRVITSFQLTWSRF